MSYKLQAIPASGNDGALPATWEEAISWLGYDSKIRPGLELPQVNWNALLGLTLAIAVSGGVWAGIGRLIVHIWK
jgi:hypothetical protein